MKGKLKIAFLLSIITERGGIGRVTSIISNHLNKQEDFEVHIISYAKKVDNSYDWNNDLPYHYLLKSQIPMKKGILYSSKKLRNILFDNKIDILITCGHIVGPLGVLGTLFNKTKLIYWSHSSFKQTSKKQFRMFNEHFTSVFASKIISLTKVDEINYTKHTFSKHVTQIYNPIDNKLNSVSKKFKSKSNNIISVGRLTDQKNFKTLIDVAETIFKKNYDFTWDIYGSGDEEEELKQLIDKKGLFGVVNLKGQSNNLYELYNNYSIMVMTSKYEGFPMSLLEGLASKLPLISFDIPTGPNEIIRNNVNGYLIEPFDINEMANKIIYLLENPNVSEEFSKNNEIFKNEYSLKSIINKWQTTLKST